MVRHKGHVIGLAQQLGGSGKVIWVPHVVSVEQRDPVPFRNLNAGIARNGRIASIYVQQFHRHTALLNLRERIVTRGVVDDDDLVRPDRSAAQHFATRSRSSDLHCGTV